MKFSLLPVAGLLAVQTLAAPSPVVAEKALERRLFGAYISTLQTLYSNIRTYTAVISRSTCSLITILVQR